jgi:hypothetical protein
MVKSPTPPRPQTRKTDILPDKVTSRAVVPRPADPRQGELFDERPTNDDAYEATFGERWYAITYQKRINDPHNGRADVWYGYGTRDDAWNYFQREFSPSWVMTEVDFTGMDEDRVAHIKDIGVDFAKELRE